MFKTLSLAVILCCISAISTAQKFSIGLRAGMNYCTAPLGINNIEIYGYPVPLQNVSGKMSGIAALRAVFDIKRFQFGLSYERTSLLYTWGQDFSNSEYNDNFSSVNYCAKTSITELIIVANMKINMRRSYVFYGINAGMTSTKVKHTEFDVTTVSAEPGYYQSLQPNNFNPGPDSLGIISGLPNFPNLEYPGTYTFTSGMHPVFGIQLGYVYKLTKNFNLSSEIGCRYITGDIVTYVQNVLGWYDRLTTTRGILHFPATLGISYTF